MFTFIAAAIIFSTLIICGIILSRSINCQLMDIANSVENSVQTPGLQKHSTYQIPTRLIPQQMPATPVEQEFVWAVNEKGSLVKIPRATLSQRILKFLEQ